MSKPKPPLLIVNPYDDEAFVLAANQALDAGAPSPEALEVALRARYPRVIVRERGLSQEPAAWYVYREGSWIETGTRTT